MGAQRPYEPYMQDLFKWECMPLCVEGTPCRPSFSRQRATLRPYIKQDSDANGVAFGPIVVCFALQ